MPPTTSSALPLPRLSLIPEDWGMQVCDIWPCEDFAIGSGTWALLVVSAWSAGEGLQMSLKELSLCSYDS